MAAYMVSYEVQDQAVVNEIVAVIKAAGDAMQVLSNFWMVSTSLTAKQLREQMLEYITPEDRLAVIKCGTGAAWKNIRGDNKWMVEHLSS
ncbi:hypothetical protein [Pseudomonas atacamensis]|uniref:hypothetical protein n=1 Tax=Pseudomonas atacamensis TaxID=2565368 RepID=UPI003C9E4E43